MNMVFSYPLVSLLAVPEPEHMSKRDIYNKDQSAYLA